MTLRPIVRPLVLTLGLAALAACAGVETGAVSPCHGQFRAEGSYVPAPTQGNGSMAAVSRMNSSLTGCAD